jgi:hypothetical protein
MRTRADLMLLILVNLSLQVQGDSAKREPGFTLETLEAIGIIGERIWQSFDCDIASELRVMGTIDNTHPAFTKR